MPNLNGESLKATDVQRSPPVQLRPLEAIQVLWPAVSS